MGENNFLTKGLNLNSLYGLGRFHVGEAIEEKEAEKTEEKSKVEEWIWVEGYKGTDKDICCRDQKYEIGSRYYMPEDEKVELCESGFHFCLKLNHVFRYYDVGGYNRFFKVKALVKKEDYDACCAQLDSPSWQMIFGGGDSKLTSKAIEFVEELSYDEVLGVKVDDLDKWTYKEKALAIAEGMSAVRNMREAAKKDQQRKDLINLGYSTAFAEWLVEEEKFDIAYAVGSQTDLSMDMKVLLIIRDDD